jgi:uncharacterized protein
MSESKVPAESYPQTVRCHTKTKRGKRCKKRTTIYPHHCWRHTIEKVGMYLKPSTIPGAGLGLFTTHDIPTDTPVTNYIGERLSAQEYEERDNGYGLVGHDGVVVDASSTQSCIARYANDCRAINIERDGLNGNNSHFDCVGGELWIVSTKHIKANEEIFVDYGLGYWGDSLESA